MSQLRKVVKNMPSSAECLRQKTGSCGGCQILGIMQQKTPRGEIDPEVIDRVAENYCPEGEKPASLEEPKQSIW